MGGRTDRAGRAAGMYRCEPCVFLIGVRVRRDLVKDACMHFLFPVLPVAPCDIPLLGSGWGRESARVGEYERVGLLARVSECLPARDE